MKKYIRSSIQDAVNPGDTSWQKKLKEAASLVSYWKFGYTTDTYTNMLGFINKGDKDALFMVSYFPGSFFDIRVLEHAVDKNGKPYVAYKNEWECDSTLLEADTLEDIKPYLPKVYSMLSEWEQSTYSPQDLSSATSGSSAGLGPYAKYFDTVSKETICELSGCEPEDLEISDLIEKQGLTEIGWALAKDEYAEALGDYGGWDALPIVQDTSTGSVELVQLVHDRIYTVTVEEIEEVLRDSGVEI